MLEWNYRSRGSRRYCWRFREAFLISLRRRRSFLLTRFATLEIREETPKMVYYAYETVLFVGSQSKRKETNVNCNQHLYLHNSLITIDRTLQPIAQSPSHSLHLCSITKLVSTVKLIWNLPTIQWFPLFKRWKATNQSVGMTFPRDLQILAPLLSSVCCFIVSWTPKLSPKAGLLLFYSIHHKRQPDNTCELERYQPHRFSGQAFLTIRLNSFVVVRNTRTFYPMWFSLRRMLC